jgi:hypothetical protein
MKYANAFLGKTKQPSQAELADTLGPASKSWNEFIQWMAEEEGVTAQEWKGICVNKYGWSLRLKQKSRNIVFLGPGKGCFLVAFTLSDEALKAAKDAHLPKAVRDALDSAPRYPEGNGLRLVVRCAADLPAVRKLAEIKLSN